MFSGIVDHLGEIISIEKIDTGFCFRVQTTFSDITLGESIAIDGVCLTATSEGDNVFSCDVSPETCSVTTLNDYKKGQQVNLERALKVGDSLGGHWVTGHVDDVASIKNLELDGEFTNMTIALDDSSARRYLVPKGSVAINGVSLTINEVFSDSFSVMLIPHTWQRTQFQFLSKGAGVNVEFDYLAKLVANQYALQCEGVECGE